MFVSVDNTTTDSKCIKSHSNFFVKFFGLVWSYELIETFELDRIIVYILE